MKCNCIYNNSLAVAEIADGSAWNSQVLHIDDGYSRLENFKFVPRSNLLFTCSDAFAAGCIV